MVVVLAVTAGASLFGQSPILHRYFYDDARQLSKVVDSSGTVVEYVYDAAGNIVQINRTTVTAGALAAFNFTPQRGPVGTLVTIQGQNFNTTPNLNTVRFNGVTATVVSASATVLVAIVPSGATTGALTVQIGANTVTAGTFTVTTPPPSETPPTVSITTPTAGATVVHGQTLVIAVSVSGPNPISAVDVSVDGFFFRTGIPAPFTTTFTVPYGVTSLTIGARARDTLGNLGTAAPVTLNVITDPKTTVQGTVVDSANAPISGASVAVKQNSLKGEYFYFPFAISSMPSLTGLTPDLVRPVSAIDFRNTDGFFSNDTFGLGVTQNFAARFSGSITIATAGTYTFTLGAATGGKLLVNGNQIAEVTNLDRYAEASGTVTLGVGTATIEVQYFNGSQIAELQLSYAASGATRQVVPSALFTPATDVFTGTSIAGGTFSIANVPVALGAVDR